VKKTSKKTGSKKSTAKTTEQPPRRRGGGRKKGEWRLLRPEQLVEYRENNKISRASLAGMMGVSSTSIQNWETGTVPTLRYQQRLAEIIKNNIQIKPTKIPSLFDFQHHESKGIRASAIEATGSIIGAYIQTHQGVTVDQLVDLIKNVRRELTPV